MVKKTKKPTKDISTKVMKELKVRGLKMHSRNHFVLLSVLTGGALIAAMVSVIYIVNISTLQLRSQAAFEYLGFGHRGLGEFLSLLPWGWILLTIALLVGVSILLKRYDFARKHHYWGIIVGITAALLLAGGISAYSGLNAPGGPKPPRHLGDIRLEERGRLRGIIVSVDGNEAVLRQPNGQEIVLELKDNRLQEGQLSKQREVLVLGEWKDDRFEVKAIRPAPRKQMK